jgi:leucyl aminopeptidase (aminopeptidase T)
MVMMERFGNPTTRIISLMKSMQIPASSVQSGDRLLVLTDDAMDPLIWQAMMAAINEKGGEGVLCMWPRLAHHFADPPQMAVEAARGADVIIALTAEILLEGGGRATLEDIKEMDQLRDRIGELYERGKKIHVEADNGTNLTAEIGGYPAGFFSEWGELPFSRNPKTGKFRGGTWPYGEAHVEPVPGTANGTVVWEVTAQYPPGRWRHPVALIIKDGRLVDIQGKTEAEQVRWFLETYGDENSWLMGGEIAIGLNKLCQPDADSVRSWKKHYGAMHFGIGHGADRKKINSVLRLEGIVDKITMVIDDTVVCDKGKILA